MALPLQRLTVRRLDRLPDSRTPHGSGRRYRSHLFPAWDDADAIDNVDSIARAAGFRIMRADAHFHTFYMRWYVTADVEAVDR